MHPPKTQHGFSLLELAIVLVVIGVITGGAITLLGGSIDKVQAEQTEAKIETIETMLLNYRRAFDRLPCPGDITLALNDANFGMAATDSGDCTGGTPAANFSTAEVAAGALPIRQLGLSDEYMFDGWGNRFLYAVDKTYTMGSAFTNNPITATDPADIVIQDTNGANRTDAGIYVLVSYGDDGHGAHFRQGGATRKDAGTPTAQQMENCDCNDAAVATVFDNVFVQRAASIDPATLTTTFDDIVVYATRGQLRGFTE